MYLYVAAGADSAVRRRSAGAVVVMSRRLAMFDLWIRSVRSRCGVQYVPGVTVKSIAYWKEIQSQPGRFRGTPASTVA
jgi:hypothetical protein